MESLDVYERFGVVRLKETVPAGEEEKEEEWWTVVTAKSGCLPSRGA